MSIDALRAIFEDVSPDKIDAAHSAQGGDLAKTAAMLLAIGQTPSGPVDWDRLFPDEKPLLRAAQNYQYAITLLDDEIPPVDPLKYATDNISDPAIRRIIRAWLKDVTKAIATQVVAMAELQKLSGAGWTDCQKALANTNDHVAKGLRWLIVNQGSYISVDLNPELTTDLDWTLSLIRQEIVRQRFGYPKPARQEELERQLEGRKPPEQPFMAQGRQARARALTIQRGVALTGVTLVNWKGEATMKAWKGLQSRGGSYGSRDSAAPSTGHVNVEFHPTTTAEPSVEQVAAWDYAMAHGPEIKAALLETVFAHVQRIRKNPFYKIDPALKRPAGLANHIGVGVVHVTDWAKQGVAYIELEMGCTWEREHGLAVMLHKNDVIAVGTADLLGNYTKFQDDGGRQLACSSYLVF